MLKIKQTFDIEDQLDAKAEAGKVEGIKSVKDASYTLQSADAGQYIRMQSTLDRTLTIPAQSSDRIDPGFVVTIEQTAAGVITIAGDSGVTLNYYGGLNTAGQYAVIQLICVAADVWTIIGGVAS